MIDGLSTPKYLTTELAAQVVEHVLATTLLATEGPLAQVMERREGCLVIVVPSMVEKVELLCPHLLYQRMLGNKSAWERPFDEIAYSKALQLWQGRNSNGQTDSNAHLLFPGDTPFWGGVARHGLVVAFSGENPWIDQMISGMTADMLKALGRDAFEKSADKMDGLTFLL